ncbi:MAG: ribonuclease P protein component [Lutibacter sp.]
MRNTFSKDEKLKSKKLIEQLFKNGKRIKVKSFQLLYLEIEHNGFSQIQVGFSVPKKRVKLAVNRNKIKRRMREVYRNSKNHFSIDPNKKFIFMFIYGTEELLTYHEIEYQFEKIQQKFKKI